MAEPVQSLQKGDALLIVDVQKDFCPGGALPIEEADKVVPVLNRWIKAAREKGIPIYASRDWHPIQHMSFKAQGGKWPPHCIQDSDGAKFHPGLELPADVVKITKGVRFDHDQYSVFDQTGLGEQLKRDEVKRLWVGGLAQDVCVLESVLKARNAGFEVNVLGQATRPVTLEGGEEAIRKMKDVGAKIVE